MRVVLDTNVVLDWLVFQETALEPLRHAVRDGRVSLLAHAPALDELRRVLHYPRFSLEAHEQQRIFEQYSEMTDPFTDCAEGRELPLYFPRCGDPDDDHFLSLAYLGSCRCIDLKGSAGVGAQEAYGEVWSEDSHAAAIHAGRHLM